MAEENMQAERSEFEQHVRAAGEAARKQWRSLIPGDFWRYRRQARREFLLAVRTAVDGAIDRMESSSADVEGRSGAGKHKVEVEVE